jgi:hypothetical protein
VGDQASWNRSKPWPLLGAGLGRANRDGEDLGDHGGILDGGDDLQGVSALGPLLDVDLEHSFEQPGQLMGQAPREAFGMIGRSLALGASTYPHACPGRIRLPPEVKRGGPNELGTTVDHLTLFSKSSLSRRARTPATCVGVPYRPRSTLRSRRVRPGGHDGARHPPRPLVPQSLRQKSTPMPDPTPSSLRYILILLVGRGGLEPQPTD